MEMTSISFVRNREHAMVIHRFVDGIPNFPPSWPQNSLPKISHTFSLHVHVRTIVVNPFWVTSHHPLPCRRNGESDQDKTCRKIPSAMTWEQPETLQHTVTLLAALPLRTFRAPRFLGTCQLNSSQGRYRAIFQKVSFGCNKFGVRRIRP
jgi:hypothetical protein